MGTDESITQWIDHLKRGEATAAQQLWERYYHLLVALAKTRLAHSRQRLGDEEDVALSAFQSLCRGAEKGDFPQLVDRQNLWPLLVVLTVRKACDLVNREGRQKRGGGRVVSESDLDTAEQQNTLEQVLSREPTPEFSAMMAEECRRLLGLLDDVQRQIALGKMEGCSNAEIAQRLHCGVRTVERKLELVRRIWEEQG